MKILLLLSAAALVVGCSGHSGLSDRPPQYDVDYGSPTKQTAKEGRQDAELHLSQGALRIYRYDFALVKTGVWSPIYEPFVELGVQERPEPFLASLTYCKAYNAVMDKAIEQRHGERYRELRDRILPGPNAIPFQPWHRGSK